MATTRELQVRKNNEKTETTNMQQRAQDEICRTESQEEQQFESKISESRDHDQHLQVDCAEERQSEARGLGSRHGHEEHHSKTSLLSLPNELLLQILAHNVPCTLTARSHFSAHMRQHAITRHLLSLSRDAFFQTYTHTLDLSCILSNLSRSKTYTHIQTSGVLVGKRSFVGQVRRLNLRVHVFYGESVGRAVEEVGRVLEGYVRLGRVRVGISTDSAQVGEKMREGVEELLGERGVRGWSVEVFVGGCQVGT